MTEYPSSPVPSDAELWPHERPFRAFGQWGQDHLDLRVFDQQTWWVDRAGQPHLLTHMSPTYKTAVIDHLGEHVHGFHAAAARKQMIEIAAERHLGLPGSADIARMAGDPLVSDSRLPSGWSPRP